MRSVLTAGRLRAARWPAAWLMNHAESAPPGLALKSFMQPQMHACRSCAAAAAAAAGAGAGSCGARATRGHS